MSLKVVLYCLLGGVVLTPAGTATGALGWWWLAGAVLAASFTPVAVFGPRGVPRQFGVIAPVLLVVTVLCTWTEAVLFIPAPELQQHRLQSLAGSAAVYLVLAAVLAGLAGVLGLTRPGGGPVGRPRLHAAVLAIVACAAAYVLYYLVFGAITYWFFTRGYYPDAERIVASLGAWFWVLQAARGALMALAVVPIVYTLRLGRGETALVAAAVLWVAGGAAPLIPPNALMAAPQRLVHIVEIFTQNAALGATAALLLRPRSGGGAAAGAVRGRAA
jgi:hypothetical protein